MRVLCKSPGPLCGKYEIPKIAPISLPYVDEWIPFNYALSLYNKSKYKKMNLEKIGVHFYIDDYQFERVWNKPELYTKIIKKFGAVCSPDFSTWCNYSFACNIFNKFRNNWIGAYWQSNGIKVIPSIGWNDERSFDWCFDGMPKGGCISVSSVGCMVKKDNIKQFIIGYNEALKRLQPADILWHGTVPQGVLGNIHKVKTFWEERRPLI